MAQTTPEITVEVVGTNGFAKTPYKAEFAAEMKALGGKWSREHKRWWFPADKEEDVRESIKRIFLAEEEAPRSSTGYSMKERVDAAVKKKDALYGGDTIDRIVAFAYHYGRETATREVSDAYSGRLGKLIQEACALRYWKMFQGLFRRFFGDREYLPFKDYLMQVTKDLGDLPTRF